jgi:hypothetical protein
MKVFARLKVISVEEPQYKKIQNKSVPKSKVICSEGDSYIALNVWGDEKIHRCKEYQYSGVEMECIISITGKMLENDNGTTYYSNNLNITNIL